MPIHNQDIAAIFDEIADLLEIDDANPFRVRAYRNASRTVNNLAQQAAAMVEAGDDLTEISGIGDALAKKIEAIVETGTVKALDDLRKKLPPGITDLLRLPGLGPKKVKTLYKELSVNSLEDLETAAKTGKVSGLPGMGKKTEAQIIKNVAARIDAAQRFLRAYVMPDAEVLLEHLRSTDATARFTICGSYRRSRDTVGDIDILAASESSAALMDAFVSYEDVTDVLARGETKSSVRLRSGLQVDLRIVEPSSYGAAMHYFTGSQAHNIAVRRRAQQLGLKMNEYGVFKNDEYVAGATEEDVFAALKLPFIEPELREDRGEIDAAEDGALPALIQLKDIKGDLHAHTTASDGRSSLREMAESARELGHAYQAITEHSQRLTIANGLDEKRLRVQIDEIDAMNDDLDGITILKGIEVDILEDGSLDLSDDMLKQLDVVIGSVHHKFNLSIERQTERVMKAMDNPYFAILGHPTGRLLLSREPFAIDIPRVIEHAVQRGCCLEINANPQRLDLHDTHARLAVESGVMLAINTDAHSAEKLNLLPHGVGQARRAWVNKKQVLNTRSLSALKKKLAAMRG